MISSQTVAAVKSLHIEDVAGRYLKLDSKNKAISPFTEEKTPSFSVHTAKNIYKCFSTGKGGDGISFVMELKKLSFQEAIEQIANDHGIEIIRENISPEKEAKLKKEQEQKKSIKRLLEWANTQWQFNEIPKVWKLSRKFSDEVLNKFKVGYANRENQIATLFEKAGFDKNELIEAALLNSKNYDAFQDRIIFPIYDVRGNVVAFSGRITKDLSPKQKAALKEKGGFIPPKYYNSSESLYTKGDHLFGLHLAINATVEKKFLILVEGNTDVLRFHEHGIENVAAVLGTALTKNQIKLIKRYTDTVCIIPDVDSAGLKALDRGAQLLIKNGISVQILLPDPGQDPDEFLKQKTKAEAEKWVSDREDYISDYKIRTAMAEADESPKTKADAISALGSLVELIEDNILRKSYYDDLCKTWSAFKSYKLEKHVKDVELPKNFNKNHQEEIFEYEFFEEDQCYFSFEKSKKVRICPFTMEYLYYVETGDIPIYVVRFTNTFGKQKIKALTADQLTVVGEFKRIVGRFYGRFIFEGSEAHLNKINIKLRGGVKPAVEPAQMGYNADKGFYVWANGIWQNQQLHQPDSYGVVTMKTTMTTVEEFMKIGGESVIEINGKDHLIENVKVTAEKIGEAQLEHFIQAELVKTLQFYYLPFADKQNLRMDEKDYTDHKRFFLIQNDKIDFKKWCKLMPDVYGPNGTLSVGYYIMSLFRDVVYKGNNFYSPLLNMFGPPQQGKSTAARSICRMWGETHGEEEGINLNTDTSSGIMEYINKFSNAIIWVNELSRNLKKEREVKIEMMKTLAGGSGRKTRTTKAYNTKNEKNSCGAILSGQDSPSFDPGLHDRVIPLKFDGQHRNPEKFDELKKLENKGYCTQITADLLQYRSLLEVNYQPYSKAFTKELKDRLKLMIKDGEIDAMPDDRIILNIVSISVPVKIFMEKTGLQFAFSFDEFFELCLKNIKYKSEIKATTNEVAQFFSVLSGSDIIEGIHYKFQKEKDGKTKLFIRLRAIMPLYRMAASRQQMSPFGENDIKDMLLMHRSTQNEEDHNPKYALGWRPGNVDFPDANTSKTSALVMDYDILKSEGVELRSSTDIDLLPENDDASLKATVKIVANQKTYMNGNAKKLLFEFLMHEALMGKHKDKEILELFNRDKNPKMTELDFKFHLAEFKDFAKGKREVIYENGILTITEY